MWGTMRGSNRLFTMQNAAQRQTVRAAARPFDVRARPRAGRLRCVKCGKAGKRPAATLHQLAQSNRHQDSEP
jgi:hypothetical protein